jgi:hypothetical protein
MEGQMTETVRFSQPKTATTSDLVDAAVKTVEQQLAANLPFSGMWGFDNDAKCIALADLDYPQDGQIFPDCRFEIRHEQDRFKAPGGHTIEVWVCNIMATDGQTRRLTSGLIFEGEYHSLPAFDETLSPADAVEDSTESHQAEAQPDRNRLH